MPIEGEGRGADVGEGGDYEGDGEPGVPVEDGLGARGDVLLDDFADSLSFGAQGRDEGAEVVHAADEYASDQDPQVDREPAEDAREDGPGDGSRSGDRGEVVAEYDLYVRRDVVDVVLWSGPGRVGQAHFFARKPPYDVGDEEYEYPPNNSTREFMESPPKSVLLFLSFYR